MTSQEQQIETPQDRIMDDDEFFDILNNLKIHHSLFYQLWLLGKPCFCYDTQTAQINFDNEGNWIEFSINPIFWDTLDKTQKLFIIGHECLHVILNHGIRALDQLKNPKTAMAVNKCMDIVVNHSLVDNFCFNRKEFDPDNRYCWIDTVFGVYSDKIKTGGSFEYYYSEYLKYFNNNDGESEDGSDSSGNSDNNVGDGGGQLVDDHSKFGNDIKNKEIIDDILDYIKDKIPDNEKTILNDFTNIQNPRCGKENKNMWMILPQTHIPEKKKWESVINKWATKYLTNSDKEVDQWARTNRRFVLLPDSLFLPSEMEIDDREKEKRKITVWFFLDTSGSCSSYASRFWKAAASLPKKRFDVKLHCFDTKVYATTLESRKLYGFGGTSFHILENYIQNTIKKTNEKYPDAVFVITDGYGTHITPQVPSVWYWFLTPYNSRSFIPDKCNVFKLSDYE